MARIRSIASDSGQPPVLDVGEHTSASDVDPSSDSDRDPLLGPSPEHTRPLRRAEEQSSSTASSVQQLDQGGNGVTRAHRPQQQEDAGDPEPPPFKKPCSNSATSVAPGNSRTLRRAYNLDGRVRNPTPAKFLGRPDDQGGNFMVVNFLLDKKINSEADAKETSERTAAIAAAANAKGYSSVKRHVREGCEQQASPKSNYQDSLHPGMAPLPHPRFHAGSWQTWTPPPPEQEQQQTPGPSLKRKRGRPKKAYPVQVVSPAPVPIQPFPQSLQAHPTAASYESAAPQQGHRPPEASQPYILTPPQSLPSYASPQASNRLSPHSTKVEQARLLTLLRSINPITVVDNLCKGLAYFGGIPEAPPPANGLFPTSARNGSGHQLISWVAELFPDGEKCPAYGKGKDYPPPVIPQTTQQSSLPERFPSPDKESVPSCSPMQAPFITEPLPQQVQDAVPPPSSSTPLKTPKKRGRPWGSKSSVFRSDKGKKRGPIKQKPNEKAQRTNTRLAQETEPSARQPAATTLPQSSESQPREQASTGGRHGVRPHLVAPASISPGPISNHTSMQETNAHQPITNRKNAAHPSHQKSPSASASPTKMRPLKTASTLSSLNGAEHTPSSSPALTDTRAPSSQRAHVHPSPPLGAITTNTYYAQSQPRSLHHYPPLHQPHHSSALSPSRSIMAQAAAQPGTSSLSGATSVINRGSDAD